MSRPQPRHRTLLTWLVVLLTQLLLPLSTATIAVLQPTPELARAVAQWAGLPPLLADSLAGVARTAEGLFGAPRTALAQASPFKSVGPFDTRDGLKAAAADATSVCNPNFWNNAAVYKTGYTDGESASMVGAGAGYQVSTESSFLADATGDGKLDLVWVLERGTTLFGIYVWAGNGNGNFATAPIKTVGVMTSNGVQDGIYPVLPGGSYTDESTNVADVNGDGKLDLVWLYRPNGCTTSEEGFSQESTHV